MIKRLIIVLPLAACLLAAFAPAGAGDARLAEAQALMQRGEVDAAAGLWREVATDAASRGDAEARDQARQALASLAFQ